MDAAQVEPRDRSFDRADLFVSLVLALIALAVYVRTAAPGLLLGDSGEFQVLAATGGLAHATGYPIYLTIAKLFTFLPFGDIAYRVNLVSAFGGAATVGLVYLLARSLGARKAYSAIGAFTLLLHPLFWWQSTLAEVYTITCAFLAGFLLCAVIWRRTGEPRWLGIGGLLGGLCLGLHHMAILTLPAMLLLLIVAKAKRKDWSASMTGAVAGIAIAFAAYMVMGSIDTKYSSINSVRHSASAYGPDDNHMKTSDFDSPLTRVMFVLTSKQFRGQLGKQNSAGASFNARYYLSETTHGLGWPAALLAIAGAAALLTMRGRRALGVLMAGAWLCLLAFILSYRIFDLEVDFLLTYVIVAALVAAGLQAAERLAFKQGIPSQGLRAGSAIAALAIVGGGILPVLSDASNALSAGKPTFVKGMRATIPFNIADPQIAQRTAEQIVSGVEPNGLVLSNWELLYPVYYVGLFKANRKDIEMVEWTPEGTGGRPSSSMLDYFYGASSTRPVYTLFQYGSIFGTHRYERVPVQTPLFRVLPR